MNTASLELCKKLQELSGWVDIGRVDGVEQYIAGYLLRKLPDYSTVRRVHNGDWYAEANNVEIGAWTGDTPENALCQLCCELIRQGILSKGGE